MYINVSDSDILTQTSKQIRKELGEIILSSVDHKSILEELESLRKQKQILIQMNSMNGKVSKLPQNNQRDQDITFKALSLSILQSIRLMKLSPAVSVSSFKPVSPKSSKKRNLLSSLDDMQY